jgi:GTPase
VIQKRVLSPNRVRRLPKCDWSWVDRRFLREFASKLSGDAVFLYYILVAVSDKNGLSYYSDNALSLMVRTSLPSLLIARQELIDHDLVAYEAPLIQVLSLPASEQARPIASLTDQATQAAAAADLQRLIAALAQKASVARKEA